MSEFAIRVEGLSKRYRIGTRQARPQTLAEAAARWARSPLDNYRRLRNLHSFAANGHDEPDVIWALQDVSFDVRHGEVVGVIGRNGAGKSTLLKILARIVEPTGGRAVLEGRVASLLEVGTGFHPDLTGRENVYLNGTLLGMRKAEVDRKFDEIVAFAEVEQFIDTAVRFYSSGMRVRLAFSVAAHLEAEILLMDEVLAVGDIVFQQKSMSKMGDAARSGRTVLLVSHNMASISQLCSQVLYLEGGRVQGEGPTHEIVTAYVGDAAEKGRKRLSELRPVGYGKDVRFLDVRLTGTSRGQYLVGQKLHVLLIVLAERSVQGVSVGLSVFSDEGVCLGAAITRETLSLMEGEERTLLLTVGGLSLAPGRYYAGLSLGQGGISFPRTDFDVIVGLPVFDVAPFSSDGLPLHYWKRGWGNLVIQDVSLDVMRSPDGNASDLGLGAAMPERASNSGGTC